MYKLIGLLKTKPGITREQFMDYYDNHHAPHALRATPMIHEHRRNYVLSPPQALGETKGGSDLDVIIEVLFKTKEDYDAWAKAMQKPEIIAELSDGSEDWFDKTASRFYFVEEHATKHA